MSLVEYIEGPYPRGIYPESELEQRFSAPDAHRRIVQSRLFFEKPRDEAQGASYRLAKRADT